MYQYALGLYWICTWYVLGKTKKRMRITFGFELWILCIAFCALYCCATSIHSMVLSLVVNSRYIYTIKSILASHSTFWLVSDVRRKSSHARPWRHWSGHQLEFPGYPFWLSKRRPLKAQFDCETLLASGIQAGTDCRPTAAPAAAALPWVTLIRPG